MQPLLSPDGKPLGMKWFTFFYTVRMVFSVLMSIGNAMLIYSLSQEGTLANPVLILSAVFALPTIVLYPYTYYLYRTIWQRNLYEQCAKLRDWTYGVLVVEVISSIFSLNPATIVFTGVVALLQFYYFKKRFAFFLPS